MELGRLLAQRLLGGNLPFKGRLVLVKSLLLKMDIQARHQSDILSGSIQRRRRKKSNLEGIQVLVDLILPEVFQGLPDLLHHPLKFLLPGCHWAVSLPPLSFAPFLEMAAGTARVRSPFLHRGNVEEKR